MTYLFPSTLWDSSQPLGTIPWNLQSWRGLQNFLCNSLVLWEGKLRPREGWCLVWGHTAYVDQSQHHIPVLNPSQVLPHWVQVRSAFPKVKDAHCCLTAPTSWPRRLSLESCFLGSSMLFNFVSSSSSSTCNTFHTLSGVDGKAAHRTQYIHTLHTKKWVLGRKHRLPNSQVSKCSWRAHWLRVTCGVGQWRLLAERAQSSSFSSYWLRAFTGPPTQGATTYLWYDII